MLACAEGTRSEPLGIYRIDISYFGIRYIDVRRGEAASAANL
jgi:hypothetical protein